MSQEDLKRSIIQKNTLIAETNIENYLRKDIGVYGFQEIENTLLQIKTLAIKFGNCDLEEIPKKRLDRINGILNNINDVMKHFIDYDRDKPKYGTKESLIENLAIYHNDYFNDVVELITYYELDKNKSSDIEKSALDILESLKFMQNEILDKKSKAFSEADDILKNLKDVASESGVTKYSEIFANEAIENKKKANHWLIAVTFFGFVSIVIAYYFLTIKPDNTAPSNYEIVHFALTKIVVFTILYYLLLLFVKNYNAQRHNYVINKHRQNALTTFATFVSSTKDNDTKNAVLLQTTHSIFASQNSGYLKNETDSEPSQKLIEIIRASSKQ